MQLPVKYDSSPLDSQYENQHDFSHLAQMLRDVCTISASGPGVECNFSKSSKMASWT